MRRTHQGVQYGTDVLLNAALWVAERLPEQDRRIHKLFKILWFADLLHLKQYGRSVTGDTYIAMNYGPVPSAGDAFRRFDREYVKDDILFRQAL